MVAYDAFGTEARVEFLYTETNNHPESFRAIPAGYRNQVSKPKKL
jgi:hypothetical protein